MDQLRPLQRLEEEFKAQIKEQCPEVLIDGQYLPDDLALYSRARNTAGSADRAAPYIGRMLEAVKGLGAKGERQLEDYLTAAGASDYLTNGMNHGLDLSAEEIKAVMTGTPQHIKDVADQVRSVFAEAVDYFAGDGIIDPVALRQWRAKYPNYVPFRRVPDADDVAYRIGVANRFVNISQPGSTKTRKGVANGEIAPIFAPLESMMLNLEELARKGAQNQVGQALVNMSKASQGMGWLAEEVTGTEAENSEQVVKVWHNGQVRKYAVDPDVYQALTALQPKAPNSAVLRVASTASELFKAGTTYYNPGFWVINLLRDAGYSSITSQRTGVTALPLGGTISGLMTIIGAKFGNAKMQARMDRAVKAGLSRAGLADVGVYGRGADRYRRAITRHTGGRGLTDVIRDAYTSTVGGINEATELAPKLAEFAYLTERKGVPEQEAVRLAREVNLDFSRGGTSAKAANRVIPFLNASLQGTSKALRVFRSQPKQALAKLALFSLLPSILLFWRNKDEPEYWQFSADIRDRFWLFRVGGHWVRIPKPDLYRAVGDLAERAMAAALEYDPEAFRGFGSSLVESVSPNFLPALLRPSLEVVTNHNFFTGRSLVPEYMADMPKARQVNKYTSTAARKLGEMLDSSPIVIDHLIKGYLGGVGKYLVDLPDTLGATGRANTDSGRLNQAPVLGRLLADPTIGAESLNRFYDHFREGREAWADFVTRRKSGEQISPSAKAKAYRLMTSTEKRLKSINKAINAVDQSAISDEEKRKRKERLRNERIKSAQEGLEIWYKEVGNE